MIQLAVGMAVGIILIVGLIWPVVDDSTDEIHESRNNTTVRYASSMMDGGEVTVQIIEGSLLVNGEAVNYLTDDFSDCIIISDKFMVTASNESMTLTYPALTVRSVSITELIISSSGITYTSDGTDTTVSMEISKVIYPDNDGDLGAFKDTNFNISAGETAYYSVFSNSTNNNKMTFYGEVVNGVATDYAITQFIDGQHIVPDNFSFAPRSVTDHGSEQYYTMSPGFTYTIGEMTSNYNTTLAIAPIEYHVVTDMDNNIRTMIAVAGMLIVVLMVVMVARNLMD